MSPDFVAPSEESLRGNWSNCMTWQLNKRPQAQQSHYWPLHQWGMQKYYSTLEFNGHSSTEIDNLNKIARSNRLILRINFHYFPSHHATYVHLNLIWTLSTGQCQLPMCYCGFYISFRFNMKWSASWTKYCLIQWTVARLAQCDRLLHCMSRVRSPHETNICVAYR